MKCDGRLIQKTGITSGNYKFFASKGDCDSFFLGKAKGSFNNYSVIRPDPSSKNGFNVACVHVQMKYDDSILCDYVSFRYDSGGRWFHCIVTDREYVNENSTRLYFVIDYVATYFDTLKLGKCLIERSHVNDDWMGTSQLGVTANKYLLPEPISANAFDRPELRLYDPFENVNQLFQPENSKYSLISSVDKSGFINKPKINFQCGGCISGYLESGSKEEIEEIISGYVTYMNKLINQANSLMNYVQSVYYLPSVVADNATQNAWKVDIDPIILPLTFINRMQLPSIKHAKTYNYFFFTVRSGANSYTFKLSDYNNLFASDVILTGSPNGNAKLRVFDKTGNYQGIEVNSPSWCDVTPSAVIANNEYYSNNWVSNNTNYELSESLMNPYSDGGLFSGSKKGAI